jgi:hypothetical protein
MNRFRWPLLALFILFAGLINLAPTTAQADGAEIAPTETPTNTPTPAGGELAGISGASEATPTPAAAASPVPEAVVPPSGNSAKATAAPPAANQPGIHVGWLMIVLLVIFVFVLIVFILIRKS